MSRSEVEAIETELSPPFLGISQALVLLFDPHNGDAQCVKAAALVPEAYEAPRGEMTVHVLEDLVEIGEGYKAADQLTVEFCHQGHFRDHCES